MTARAKHEYYTHKFSAVSLPSGYFFLVGHSEVDRVDRVGRGTGNMTLLVRVKQPLVVLRVVSIMEPSRQAEVGEFDMSILINEDIVRFDITVNNRYISSLINSQGGDSPMNEAKFVHRFNS